jgi:hypothetical protein
MTRPRVIVYAPQLYELGFKQHHIDGEALALYACLTSDGYDCVLVDAYYRGTRQPSLSQAITQASRPEAVIAHLWTSDAYGPRLRAIAAELTEARRTFGIPVIGFGPLAVSASAELVAHGAIDYATGLDRHHQDLAADTGTAGVGAAIGRYLRGHTPLTTLGKAELPYLADAVVSVSASRGCQGRCTFCAYNSDLGGGWLELPVPSVVADIAHLHQLTGATRFALADSDFGGNPAACRTRARQLADGLAAAGLNQELRLSVSIRTETLDPGTVQVLAEAGVRTMLIGVESFNPDTLHRLYGKRQDLKQLADIVSAADAYGITTVASYILWHPWQTIASIRDELSAISAFGRWRVPQFMARSRLLVIPGTVIERKIRDAGLLDTAPFERRFRFADPGAAALDQALHNWFEHNAMPVLTGLSERRDGDLAALGSLKHAEWQWLTQTAGVPAAVTSG